MNMPRHQIKLRTTILWLADVPRCLPVICLWILLSSCGHGPKKIPDAVRFGPPIKGLETPGAPLGNDELVIHKGRLSEHFGCEVESLVIHPLRGRVMGWSLEEAYYAEITFCGRPAKSFNGVFMMPERALYVFDCGTVMALEKVRNALRMDPDADSPTDDLNEYLYRMLVRRAFRGSYIADPQGFDTRFLGDWRTGSGFRGLVLREELFHRCDAANGVSPADSELRILLLHVLRENPFYALAFAYQWQADERPEIYRRHGEFIDAIEATGKPLETISAKEIRHIARDLLKKSFHDAGPIDDRYASMVR